MIEQQVVQFPERILVGGRFRRFGGELRVRVHVVQRQVAPDVTDVGEVAEQLAHDRLGLPAVRALEVAVLDHRHRRVARPAPVVAVRIDVGVEVGQLVGGPEQRADAEAAR